MDTDILVADQIEDGRKFVAQLTRNNFDVSAAFWVKTSEEGRWVLYVASTVVDEKGLAAAYREAYSVLQSMAAPSVTLSEVKLIGPGNRIARDALKIQQSHPGRAPTRTQQPLLGRLAIEEAYIYPQATEPMTRQEVLQTVVDLMNRTGPPHPAVVTLRDGSALQAVPVGIDRQPSGTIRVVLHDVVANTDRAVAADDVVNIR